MFKRVKLILSLGLNADFWLRVQDCVWFTDPLTTGSIRCSKQVQKDPRVRKWVQNSAQWVLERLCESNVAFMFTDSSPELPNQPGYGQGIWQGTNQLVSLTPVIQSPHFHPSLGGTLKEGSKKNILVGIFACWGAFLHCKETELEGNKNSKGADLFPFWKTACHKCLQGRELELSE